MSGDDVPRRRARIFTDLDLAANAPWTPAILEPFIRSPGDWEDDFNAWVRHGNELFELSSLEICDAAVMPFGWELALDHPNLRRQGERFASLVRDADKPLIVFCDDDHSDLDLTDLDPSMIFKMSLYASRRRSNEHAQPAAVDDLLRRFGNGEVAPRPKGQRPTVGFCGHSPMRGPLPARLRHVLATTGLGQRIGLNAGMVPRVRALRALARSEALTTRFIFPPSSVPTGPWGNSLERRRAYARTTLESDYVLCVRGFGNFSFRLYETLCLGRIPLFVDTDCVLPAEDRIDWRALCLVIDESEIDSIAERVAEDYASMTDESMGARQRACRAAWEEHLCSYGFFRGLRDDLLGVGSI
jgi:hypothetical protein